MRSMENLGPLRTKTLILTTLIVILGVFAFRTDAVPLAGSERVFRYSATRLGVPILRATIRIESTASEQGRPIYRISASLYSLDYLKFLFRINNRFVSTIEGETLAPIRYVKEIHQEGLLAKKKNYIQTVTFDHSKKKLIVENRKEKEKERTEVPLSVETHDPFSIFAKYYLTDELYPGQDIQMCIFDGMRLRHLVFVSRKEKVTSKTHGEIEAVCLESSTSFSSFDDREGKIRIWYAKQGEKIPILIELELPVGDIKFELDS